MLASDTRSAGFSIWRSSSGSAALWRPRIDRRVGSAVGKLTRTLIRLRPNPTWGNPKHYGLSRRVVLLQPKLPGRLATTPRGLLACQVTNPKPARIHKQAVPVHQHLGLARGGLDHGGPLQHRGHPDAAAVVDLGLEVRKDLVVLVQGDCVKTDQLTGGLRRGASTLSV